MSNISRSNIGIRLFGVELDPQRITQLLGCAPSSAAKTGEKIINASGIERIAKKGFWILDYEARDEIIIEEKIKVLLGKLTDDLEIWQEITRNLDVADINCGLFIDNWNEGFTLSQSTLRKISDRNLEIGFDIYSPTDTWYRKDEESEVSEKSE